MALRTAKLGALQGGVGSWSIVCTVPAGQTYIVKDIRYYNTLGSTDTVTIALVTTGAVTYPLVGNQSLGANAANSWQGWAVLGPGETLQAFSTTGGTRFWASGAKLDGVAP